MIRRVVALAFLILLAGVVSASAQTGAIASSVFSWTQGAPDLATAQTLYSYRVYEGVLPVRILTPICTGTVSPFTCETKVGVWSDASHTVVLKTGMMVGTSLVESAATAPVVFTYTSVAIPATPGSFKVEFRLSTP